MAIQVAAGEVLVDEAPVGSAITTMGSAEGSPTRIPVSRYTSTDFAALEAERLWPRVWQIACSVDHVAQPGDFFEYRVGAYAVLIVRGDDGELRAFQNVCRHRGNVLCSGSGSGLSELRCGYHRWSWDLQGRLREVPSRRGFGLLRNEDFPLLAASVGTWGPIVFVNLDPDAMPARRLPRRGPRRHRVGRHRRLPVHGDGGGPHRSQLEDDLRRLQRDVPRAGPAPRDAGVDGRHQLGPAPLAPSRQVGAALRGAEPALPPTALRPGGVGFLRPDPRRADGSHRAGPGATRSGGRHGRRRDRRGDPPPSPRPTVSTCPRFDTAQMLCLNQYNLFPNATVLVAPDLMTILCGRPGPTPDSGQMVGINFRRAADAGRAPQPARRRHRSRRCGRLRHGAQPGRRHPAPGPARHAPARASPTSPCRARSAGSSTPTATSSGTWTSARPRSPEVRVPAEGRRRFRPRAPPGYPALPYSTRRRHA